MTNTNERVQWFEDGINKNHINYHEYDEFQNIQHINSGGFGNVCRANWKSSDTVVALKSFRNDSCITKQIINELQLLREVNFHTNIIRCFGITKRKEEEKIDSDYLLILEYADGGTLRDYLKDNFNKLDFIMKLQFAIQIADAVSCLHQKNIIHCDLHSKNILVHRKIIKLADFGLSRRLAEVSNSVKDVFGMFAYIDPRLHIRHYKANKKSDVYSVGMLLWEISSGRQPFESYDKTYQIALLLEILEGKRETPIPGIPNDYINIYEKCWQYNPDDRPEIQQVFSELKQINLKMKTLSTDKNEENNIDNDCGINTNSLCPSYSRSLEVNFEDLIIKDNNENIIDELLLLYEKFIQKVIYEEDYIQLIKQCMISKNKNENEIFNYLLENKDNQQNIILLANFYQFGIGTDEEKVKTFKLYKEASEKGIASAIKGLEYCYINGIGTAKDEEKAAIEDNENLKIDNRKEGESTFYSIGYTSTKKIINEPNALKESKMITVVPSTKFLPFISEIGNLFNEAVEIVQTAEHNKRICDILLQRVYAANLAVLELKIRRNQEFFNDKNYLLLQDLVTIIAQIKKFIADISQMKTLLSYIQAKSIEKTFKKLCNDFDSCIVSIDISNFTTSIIRPDKEAGALTADQEDLAKHIVTEFVDVKDIPEIGYSIKGICSEFSSMVLKINSMNNTMEKHLDEQTIDQSKIDKIFKVHKLKFSDYKETNKEPRGGETVTKWVNDRNCGEEFAFKRIFGQEERNNVQNQVTILRELHNCQNIIKFYGLVCDGNKWYLVTEWAEYGNLREFYTTHKDRFDLRLKLRISLDIASGLNFLRSVEIVHRDIRAENILITISHIAKLTNFKLSRSMIAATLRQKQNLERVRYCAPELLERIEVFKYDHKCEVYSFGILLWEIAEEKVPYQDYKDIVKITDLVRSKMNRESFSENSPMPQKFQELAIQAVNRDPEFRPKIAVMFNILQDCFESFEKPLHTPSTSASSNYDSSQDQIPIPPRKSSIDQDIPDFESFKYMTLADAVKQHKMVDRTGRIIGDIRTAYKCFEAYANLNNRNQIKAKYYKALYISRRLVKLDMSNEEQDKVVASLFKEVADDEANEFPKAILRYGDCLYHGEGVEQNLPKALEYFEKAAENGLKVAMYNAGKLHYNGGGGKINAKKAIEYLKLATYHEYQPALKFCKVNCIPL